jgi:hypothetical protein
MSSWSGSLSRRPVDPPTQNRCRLAARSVGPTGLTVCPLLPSIRARQTPGPFGSGRYGGLCLLRGDAGQRTGDHEWPEAGRQIAFSHF